MRKLCAGTAGTKLGSSAGSTARAENPETDFDDRHPTLTRTSCELHGSLGADGKPGRGGVNGESRWSFLFFRRRASESCRG